MIVGFTGSRKGMTDEQKQTVRSYLQNLSPLGTVHGDCVGADADFHDIVQSLGILIKLRPCNLENQRAFCQGAETVFSPLPPLERNIYIIYDADVMIACPDGFKEKRRSGTWSTIRKAKTSGKKLIVVWPDGTVHVQN